MVVRSAASEKYITSEREMSGAAEAGEQCSGLHSRYSLLFPRFLLSAHQAFGRAAIDRDVGAMDKATSVGSEEEHEVSYLLRFADAA